MRVWSIVVFLLSKASGGHSNDQVLAEQASNQNPHQTNLLDSFPRHVSLVQDYYYNNSKECRTGKECGLINIKPERGEVNGNRVAGGRASWKPCCDFTMENAMRCGNFLVRDFRGKLLKHSTCTSTTCHNPVEETENMVECKFRRASRGWKLRNGPTLKWVWQRGRWRE
ncbi:hypothetical protein V6N13_043739 [Hibiscus sabdariffa]